MLIGIDVADRKPRATRRAELIERAAEAACVALTMAIMVATMFLPGN